MPNTTLPTNVTAGTTGHAGMHNTIAAELNRMTRDTGLRDASSLIANGWTLDSGGFIYIRRVDDEVTLYMRGLNGSAATSNTFLIGGTAEPGVLSRDFRPSVSASVTHTTVSPLYRATPNGTPWFLFYDAAWRCGTQNSAATPPTGFGSAIVQWTYKTAMPWPTNLPPAVTI